MGGVGLLDEEPIFKDKLEQQKSQFGHERDEITLAEL